MLACKAGWIYSQQVVIGPLRRTASAALDRAGREGESAGAALPATGDCSAAELPTCKCRRLPPAPLPSPPRVPFELGTHVCRV